MKDSGHHRKVEVTFERRGHHRKGIGHHRKSRGHHREGRGDFRREMTPEKKK